MPRNTSGFGDIPITPLSGRMDLRSPSGTLPISDFRLILNSSMNEFGKRCRRPGWRKYGAGSPRGFNNQDLHDQLGSVQDDCTPGSNNCVCPEVPQCLRLVDYVYGVVLDNCVDGESSDAPAWDGTLTRTGDCTWGFSYNQYSFGGKSLAVVVNLDSCSGHNVFKIEIVVRLEDGTGLIVWKGESPYTPIGTYERTDGCDETPTITLENCDACDEPVVTSSIPSGSMVAEGSYLALFTTLGANIFFTTDGSTPDNTSELYVTPFQINDDMTVRAIAYTGTCVSDVYTFTYEIADNFLFEFTCDDEDQAGVFDEFDPNGSPDNNWRLSFSLPEVDIESLEIYETDSGGVWVTGQSWATKRTIYPEELGGDGFESYPAVIYDTGVQLNTDYTPADDNLIDANPSGDYVWMIYGQPFVALTAGYFKLVFTYNDGEEKKIYAVIQAECSYYYEDGDDEVEVPPSAPSRLINVDLGLGGSTKTGEALIGDPGDIWNDYAFKLTSESEQVPMELVYADGNPAVGESSNTALATNHPDILTGMFSFEDSNGHDDDMMEFGGVIDSFPDSRQLRFTELLPGTYDLVVYGHGTADNHQLRCRAGVGGGTLSSYKETANGPGWISPTFTQGVNCVAFDGILIEESTINLVIDFGHGDSGECYVSGIQLSRRA